MNYSEKEIKDLENKAKDVRRLIVQILARAGSGHPGGSLSATDLISVLFFKKLNYHLNELRWKGRDRVHFSKGHACPLLFVLLSKIGHFPEKELWNLRRLNSILQGHPDKRTPGVEISSGSLGQGLSVAVGMALAGRLDKMNYSIYCLLGDGEVQEGEIWEAAMSAAFFKLDNLCAILDYNKFQIDGRVEEIMNIEPLVQKWQAFGWNVLEIDGHNIKEILKAYDNFKTAKEKPTIIIAHTIKGKGVSFMENVVDFHGRTPTEEETEKAMKELR
ncbi:MAG: transketolase [Candidatus Omnitrophica bacterium]|nr:transketolase [Candidatus Omnitrophota bacterium]